MREQAVHFLEEQFETFVRTHDLVQAGSNILMAVSGGVDSMVMVKVFSQFRSAWNLTLHIAHVNHQLRGAESERDEEFVRRQAAKLSIPFFVRRVDTSQYSHLHRLSKQEAARELRYSYFEELRHQLRADCIATAHQANDNAETVLMNAVRGSGIRGLSGIPIRRDALIRPLLFAYRSDIEDYAATMGVEFHHDSSNDSNLYTRNVVRKRVLPLLQKEVNPDVVVSLNRLSELMRDLDQRMEEQVRVLRTAIVSQQNARQLNVDIPRLAREPLALQEGVMLHLLRELRIEPTATKISQLLHLCTQLTGRRVNLSSHWTALRDRERLVFIEEKVHQPIAQSLSLNSSYDIGRFRLSISPESAFQGTFEPDPSVAVVDAAQLGPDLVLRSWRRGDWFIPLGMRSRKKLSDFFTDEKIPLHEKTSVPLIESGDRIVWVCGRRLDDRFKITENTRSVVKLSYSPIPTSQ